MKYILITGVSTGIGYDAVRHFVGRDFFVFGSVRKEADQQRLESEFPERFKCLLFDICDRTAIAAAVKEVEEVLGGELLTCLVNNAGVALAGPLQLVDDERFDHQLLVNVSGTRNVINAFLPLLGATKDRDSSVKPGKIINNSSISGVVNTPINGSYCVSKHAIESLGEVYRRELMMYGIDVISIQSGPIQSQIWEKNIGASSEFEDSDYRTMIKQTEAVLADAQKIAQPPSVFSELIEKIIYNRRPRLAYVIHQQRWQIWLLRWLPRRWVDRLMYKKLSNPDTGS